MCELYNLTDDILSDFGTNVDPHLFHCFGKYNEMINSKACPITKFNMVKRSWKLSASTTMKCLHLYQVFNQVTNALLFKVVQNDSL